MASIKEIIQDRLRNYAFAIAVLVVVASISIILLILKLPEGWEWVKILANSTLGAVIGAALVDIVCSIADGKEAEEDMRKGIMETLCSTPNNNEKPQLYSLYKKQAIEPILNQCLSAYCASPQLSSGYLSYIKDSCRHIKRNEVYMVEVNRNATGTQTVKQTLQQTPVFKPEPTERPYFQAYFIFKNKAAQTDNENKKALDKIMDDKSYFFREELADDNFVQELLDARSKAETEGTSVNDAVLAKLNFSVDIFKCEKESNPVTLKNEDFLVEFEECGVKIKATIPEDYVVASDRFFEEEGFVQYTARMKTEYRIPACQNTFYVVYAIPTLNSYFSISFNSGVCIESVDYMTFMSIDKSYDQDSGKDGRMLKTSNTFSFDTSRTVFPRSGMAFTWEWNR